MLASSAAVLPVCTSKKVGTAVPHPLGWPLHSAAVHIHFCSKTSLLQEKRFISAHISSSVKIEKYLLLLVPLSRRVCMRYQEERTAGSSSKLYSKAPPRPPAAVSPITPAPSFQHTTTHTHWNTCILLSERKRERVNKPDTNNVCHVIYIPTVSTRRGLLLVRWVRRGCSTTGMFLPLDGRNFFLLLLYDFLYRRSQCSSSEKSPPATKYIRIVSYVRLHSYPFALLHVGVSVESDDCMVVMGAFLIWKSVFVNNFYFAQQQYRRAASSSGKKSEKSAPNNIFFSYPLGLLFLPPLSLSFVSLTQLPVPQTRRWTSIRVYVVKDRWIRGYYLLLDTG